MREFELIDYLAGALGASRGAEEGIGDDGAILNIPPGKQLVIATDTLVEGVHFEAGIDSEDIAYKALAVNLSDLAAMAARPTWYFLALTIPELQRDWMEGFARGLQIAAGDSGIRVAGGDTTRGPLNITITACGLVERGAALTREGAKPGDLIGISGPTGLAAYALAELQGGRAPSEESLCALRRPRPRLAFGQALGGLAHSGIDISDGLLADLGHIASASSVGARIELARLPVPAALSALPEHERWDLQLAGGDDYELCFTAPEKNWEAVAQAARLSGCEAICIGAVNNSGTVEAVGPEGDAYTPDRSGYVHGGENG